MEKMKFLREHTTTKININIGVFGCSITHYQRSTHTVTREFEVLFYGFDVGVVLNHGLHQEIP